MVEELLSVEADEPRFEASIGGHSSVCKKLYDKNKSLGFSTVQSVVVEDFRASPPSRRLVPVARGARRTAYRSR